MPTAEEFRDAAVRNDALAENLARLASMLEHWPLARHLEPSSIHDEIGAQLSLVADELYVAADDLTRVARVCRFRAAICEEYENRLNRHWALPVLERMRAALPVPPYSWVAV